MGRRKVFKIRYYEPLAEQTEPPVRSVRENDDSNCCRCHPHGWGALPPIRGEEGAGNGRSLVATPGVEAAGCHGCHLHHPSWATVVRGNSRWESSPGESPEGERRPRCRGRGCWRGHGKTGSSLLSGEVGDGAAGVSPGLRGCHGAGRPGGACDRAGAAPPHRVRAGRAGAAAAPLRERPRLGGGGSGTARAGRARLGSPGSARLPPAGQVRPRSSFGTAASRWGVPGAAPPPRSPQRVLVVRKRLLPRAVLPQGAGRSECNFSCRGRFHRCPSVPPPASPSRLKRANLR